MYQDIEDRVSVGQRFSQEFFLGDAKFGARGFAARLLNFAHLARKKAEIFKISVYLQRKQEYF